jgi:hypothetical protein
MLLQSLIKFHEFVQKLQGWYRHLDEHADITMQPVISYEVRYVG